MIVQNSCSSDAFDDAVFYIRLNAAMRIIYTSHISLFFIYATRVTPGGVDRVRSKNETKNRNRVRREGRDVRVGGES